MPDISHTRLSEMGCTGVAFPLEIRAMVAELQRRREADQAMLLEVDILERFASRDDSRHPITQGAVRRVLEAIQKARG